MQAICVGGSDAVFYIRYMRVEFKKMKGINRYLSDAMSGCITECDFVLFFTAAEGL